MSHAQIIEEFIPSVEEALLYMREWMQPNNRIHQNYLRINEVFEANTTDYLSQCEILSSCYRECLAGVSRMDAVNRILAVDSNLSRIKQGDITVVDDIKVINGRRMYVFATMFCHHHNPNAYYAYSSIVGNMLIRLNRLDHFYNSFDSEYLKLYPQFHSVMDNFVRYYHLESLTNLQIDVMLNGANNLQ